MPDSPEPTRKHTPPDAIPPGMAGALTVEGDVRPAPDARTASMPAAPHEARESDPAVPASIGRFEVEAFLGEGAFGRVYRAYDPSLKRAVALKVAKPEALLGERRAER